MGPRHTHTHVYVLISPLAASADFLGAGHGTPGLGWGPIYCLDPKPAPNWGPHLGKSPPLTLPICLRPCGRQWALAYLIAGGTRLHSKLSSGLWGALEAQVGRAACSHGWLPSVSGYWPTYSNPRPGKSCCRLAASHRGLAWSCLLTGWMGWLMARGCIQESPAALPWAHCSLPFTGAPFELCVVLCCFPGPRRGLTFNRHLTNTCF